MIEAKSRTVLVLSLAFVLILFSFGLVSAVQSAVNLGTAGDFAVLAKSGISNTGTTSITGDIGVSPIAATGITGFGLIMDSSNQFSTSSLVIGKAYAPNYAVPTPDKMTIAIHDMETAYTDAQGRTHTTIVVNLGYGDISGMTLMPGISNGLYKWSTGLLINSDVTLSGSADDVFIFQIAGDLTIGSGAKIILNGVQAKNIFWAVAGQVTLGTTSNFKGNILSQTLIAMNTGATLNGRALAQTAVTLDGNTVTKPSIQECGPNPCPHPECGNGNLEIGEECDDGNRNTDDGCSYTCTIEHCGDWIKQENEECEDGNNWNGDGCSSLCKLEIEPPTPVCGNNILELGEQCDKGILNGFLCWAGYGTSCTYCTTSCKLKTITNYCGDGILNSACEECDDGNTNNTDSCSNLCKINNPLPPTPICGNGIKEGTEQCDDGNSVNTDSCSNLCKINNPEPPTPTCGDCVCNGTETCSTCSSDCGVCPTPKPTKENFNPNNFTQFCNPNWDCSGWSECFDGVMTRNCVDDNHCGVEYNKPYEQTDCKSLSKVYVEKLDTSNFWLILGIILLIVLLIILINII